MQYVICQRSTAELHDFKTAHHLKDEKRVVLSEKEVMSNRTLSGTLNERAAQLDGVACSLQDAKFIFN
jgi:hypothetical protein